MTGTVHHIHPHRHHEAPRLALVATPPPRRRPLSATLALFGLAGAGLAAWRWRRRRA